MTGAEGSSGAPTIGRKMIHVLVWLHAGGVGAGSPEWTGMSVLGTVPAGGDQAATWSACRAASNSGASGARSTSSARLTSCRQASRWSVALPPRS